MDILLQIGLGLSVSFIAVWMILIKRKAFRLKPIIGAALLTVACGGLITGGILRQLEQEAPEEVMSAKQMISYCNTLLAANEVEEAIKQLKAYSAEYGYDNEASYVMAKAKALTGNYEEALGIYKRLSLDDKYAERIEDELELLEKREMADASYLPMMELLEANGMEPADYGYTPEYVQTMEEALEITDEEIAEEIIDHIEDEYDTDEYEEYIELASEIDGLYNSYVNYGYGNLGEEETKLLEDAIDDLKDAEEDKPELMYTGLVSDARLKVALIQQDYKEFAGNISVSSGYEDLVIASELYLNGTIDEGDFSDKYKTEYDDDSFSRVADQLEILMDRQEDKIAAAELRKIEEMKDSLDKAEDAPVLYALKEQLDNELTDGNTESSKIELAISKIEHYYENEALSKERFSEALLTGKDSEDYEYAQAMTKIEGILNSTDSNELRYVDTYVEQAIHSSMPLDSYDIVARSAAPNENVAEDGEQQEDFSQMLTNYISELKSSIVIGQIDTSEFETVKASVAISSDYAKNSKELKEILKVYDCGVEITNFEIEKIEYDSMKTMLICDVSGSMGPSIEDLRSAVNHYVENLKDSEQVAIVSFSDGMRGSIDFTKDVDALLQFSATMWDGGGTQIYNTLHGCMSGMETSVDCNEIIILMTDGQDGMIRDIDTINREIGAMATDKGITVYTMGLGNVDMTYLENIAACCNGEFVYVSDSQSLVSFYGMLQGQVDNQYLLTYKAKDTMQVNNRTLELRLQEDNVFDEKFYTLRVENEDGTVTNPTVPGTTPGLPGTTPGLQASELAITGLDIRSAYKSKSDITANLKGSGFTADASASMKFIGDLEYDIAMEYVDESTYKVTIPSSLAVGTYHVEVAIGDKKAYLVDAFSLWAAGDTKTVKYGPYTFTASSVKKTKNVTVLSGNVTMNGWLTFNGEVTLEGDLKQDAQIRMTENSGSYVVFDSATATGVGAFFAEKGIAFNMPALGSFTLYNDFLNNYDYSTYQVDSIRTMPLKIYNLVNFSSPVIKLYPDNIKLEYSEGTTILPFQDAIFKAADIPNPFSFSAEGSVVVTNKNVGIIVDIDGEHKEAEYKQFNVFNAPIYLDLNKLKISINTLDHEYTFGGLIKIAFIDFGLGAEVNLKGFALDGFMITIDSEKTLMLGQVPVTFSNARFGAENIIEAVNNNDFGNVMLKGQLDIGVAKVSAFFPAVKKYVGDMSLASLSDATIAMRWKPFTLSTSAEMKIFDEFTLAKSSFVMGNYTYSNRLLGLQNREVVGFSSEMKQGFMWDIDKCHIDISGTGNVTGNNKFIGIQYEGTAEIKIDWWLFDPKEKKSGTILAGVFYTEQNEPQFTVAVAYVNWLGQNKKLYYYIDKNGKTGDKNGKL